MAYEEATEISDILSRVIPWETYSTARLISDKEFSLIKRYDKRNDETRASMLDENGQEYIAAFMSILKSVTKEETVQYVLALFLQLLQENPARAKLFQSEQYSSQLDPYVILLKLLQRQDWFTLETAAKLLTVVIEGRPKKSQAFANGVLSNDQGSASYGSFDPAEMHISSFVEWLASQLRRPSNPGRSIPAATVALASLLKERGTRVLFTRANGVQVLPHLLKLANVPTSSQLLYKLVLCVWQLTFLDDAAVVMSQTGMVRALSDVCRSAQKEKVLRVALASLKQLILVDAKMDLGIGSEMVESGLDKVITVRQLQSYGDEDISDLLSFLDEKLRHGIQILSNFEKYKKEMLGGNLDWSPMHTNDVFWRENVAKFEEKDFQVLRVLLKLIEQSRDPKTLSVACHDLGMFILFHPQGRNIITDLRGKEFVMRLLAHSDAEVQKQALLCVQKIMLTRDKLDFLQSISV
mmetsp:Transcript_27680/g.51119  ORF Transcript_27680/g.51119 Transcript_27680/m.51119 type:complete len:467 (-) Transcript_27680:677-2077(-)|eukprot:CAMPEP_0175052410 /NCGR_PEP_ID=MMETSP0052_2-20121109/8346_1 /TAXON_ID=51329 ORGANISM="Polytomella parva, Strain SAG 63-3" /NCGR_SAMPLE_ID=MMETSP0052_2 /ASSEMBLY_ACC=CAM_ASM_000194 /LENGTH=466 /DNA_ID=CAMNT_0016316815 /DNA_START=141 /DNA_END=1541 /DNA_ORIENTATION=-